MHNNNMRFWQYVAKKYHRWFALPRVLELGSFNVNGTVRDVFHSFEEYIGVDERHGPCVDVRCCASEVAALVPGEFDIVISASMLEHDSNWQQTLDAAISKLKAHGLLLLSWGGALNDPHEQHAMEWAPLRAGDVLDYLAFRSIYVHEFHYEANLPTFVASEARPLRAKGFGEVVLVGFRCEADAIDLGPRSIDELLPEDRHELPPVSTTSQARKKKK
jgi:SAM-dependent methyltransferase